MKYSEMFPSKFLQAEDLSKGQTTIFTIQKIFARAGKHSPGGDEPEMKWSIKFIEHPKPMGLWPQNAAILRDMYGDGHENWIGRKVAIYPATYMSFGELKPCINFDKWDPAQIASAASRIQTVPATGGTSLVVAGDRRRIPPGHVERFKQHCAGLGGSQDKFLLWAKTNAPDALQLCFGLAVEDYPAGVLPAMKVYLDSLVAPGPAPTNGAPVFTKVVTPGAGREAVLAATGEVIIQNERQAVPAAAAKMPVSDGFIDEKDIPF